VYSPNLGYAGTCDGFLSISDLRAIFDYKSSREDLNAKGKPKGPYSEVALQLAAYRHGEFATIWRPARRFEHFRRRYYALGATEREMSVSVAEAAGGEVEAGLAIYITPERCEAYVVRCDEPVFEAFLARLDDARFEFETSRDVIGAPLIPEARA
jgi:hypothetical protein